ncbi:MAG: hypothetical protein QNK23_11745 [Crocinitomicaceae bacterium]|nr:hypothetical protein [Crocinitomicaceae bacterium]
MKNSLQLFVVLVFSTLLLGSCDKFLNNSIKNITPIEHLHFDAGSSMKIKATFEDKAGLTSFRVRIGNRNGTNSSSFPWEVTENISGESYTFESTPQIPNDIQGTFYIIFEITNAEGGTSERFHEFHIDN